MCATALWKSTVVKWFVICKPTNAHTTLCVNASQHSLHWQQFDLNSGHIHVICSVRKFPGRAGLKLRCVLSPQLNNNHTNGARNDWAPPIASNYTSGVRRISNHVIIDLYCTLPKPYHRLHLSQPNKSHATSLSRPITKHSNKPTQPIGDEATRSVIQALTCCNHECLTTIQPESKKRPNIVPIKK